MTLPWCPSQLPQAVVGQLVVLYRMCPVVLLVISCVLTSRELSAVRTVMVRNQTEPVLVVEGRTVRMSCRTDKQWFFCLWHSPSQDKQCAIQYHQPERICSKSNRTRLHGGRDRCDVEFEVRFGISALKIAT